jgi:hypothetical protein
MMTPENALNAIRIICNSDIKADAVKVPDTPPLEITHGIDEKYIDEYLIREKNGKGILAFRIRDMEHQLWLNPEFIMSVFTDLTGSTVIEFRRK